MKRILALLLSLVLVFTLAACSSKENNNATSGNNGNSGSTGNDSSGATGSSDGSTTTTPVKKGVITKLKNTDPTSQSTYTLDCMSSMKLYDVPKSKYDSKADKLYDEIEAVKDTLKPKSGGKGIYVSNDGSDSNDGSKAKPFATINKAVSVSKSGDVIYLNRGDLWRENITSKEGVSFGAYGSGNKPTVYGSPRNFAESTWRETETENVYSVSTAEAYNIGAIIFNHGQAVGSAKTNLKSLKENFDYYEDLAKKVVYVYMEQGNPADVCQSIEFASGQHIFALKSNSSMQNIRLMYGGAHAVSMQNVENVSFEGMVIGYIGGSFQDYTSKLRYGNAIEIWGTCDNYKVDHCFVFQCYDAGLTMQFSSDENKAFYEENIVFSNNLLDYNYYAIEYFFHCRVNPNSAIRNVKIDSNIIRFSGYGWGEYSRKDKGNGSAIKGNDLAMRTDNFVISNNIFEMSYTEHRRNVPTLIFTSGIDITELPTFKNNIYAQTSKYSFANVQTTSFGADTVLEALGDSSGKVVKY